MKTDTYRLLETRQKPLGPSLLWRVPVAVVLMTAYAFIILPLEVLEDRIRARRKARRG